MTLALPKIYPITDTRLSGLSHLEQVKRFAEGGARFVQLRDKDASPREFYEAALAVMSFAGPRGIKVIINDRVDIAIAVKADGVHLGQDDLPTVHARKLLGEDSFIGFSTHSLDQALEAASLPVDYIAIGPVFRTSTKENPDPVIGVETVSLVRDGIGDVPLVAIGGINRENYHDVLVAGASSVAIIGNLLNDPQNISAAFRSMSE